MNPLSSYTLHDRHILACHARAMGGRLLDAAALSKTVDWKLDIITQWLA